MASNDPDLGTKAADIIGLYLDPPRHAAVFCIDEETAIQALERRDRMLPLSPGRGECHRFEYKRHGTLSLYASLNVQTGEVQGKTTARHTSLDFVGFLREVVTTRAPDEEVHVILDNLSTHKTKLVEAFLEESPNVTLHFTSCGSRRFSGTCCRATSSRRPWIWRASCGGTSTPSEACEAFRWKYANPARRITHGELASRTVH